MSHQFQNRPDGTRPQVHHTQASDRDELTANRSNSTTPSAVNIMRLQHTIGNQAVMRLMNKSSSQPTIQRTQKIDDNVVINGSLMVEDRAAVRGTISGRRGDFIDNVHGKKFVEW